MPKSKSRKKTSSRRYQLAPSAKKKHRSSPGWYGPLILGMMALGVLVIVLNYVGLIPGTDGTTPAWLWVGLGLIATGFIGTIYWY
jgi:hypothetical protein